MPSSSAAATVTTGVATIAYDQQFCFALGAAVSQGGDFRFSGGIYGSTPRLKPAYRISPLDSRDLTMIAEVPAAPPSGGFRGFIMSFSNSNGYDHYAKLVVGQSYAVVCADEFNYAMIRVLGFDRDAHRYPSLTFAWAYQPNGSPKFFDQQE